MITSTQKNVIEINKDKKFDPEFDNFKWVLKSRSENKDYIKPIFNKVLIDEENIVCTNTRIMFIIPNLVYGEKLKSGLYSIATNNNKEINLIEYITTDQFPNYKNVLPKEKNIKLVYSAKTGFRESTIPKLYKSFYKSFPKETLAFNIKYFELALGKCDFFEFYVSMDKEGKFINTAPILIKSEKREAIIMPIQIQEY